MAVDDDSAFFVDSGKSTFIIRAAEAAMILSDRMNGAYVREVFEDTYIVAGQQLMPFHAMIDKEVQKIINFVGNIVFPVCIALCMPIFLHHLVMEKEYKLVENMKTNGLRMYNYWVVNGIYSFFSFACTAALYIIVGRYVLVLDFFAETNLGLFLELFFVWGLNQVSLAMFLSSLFSSSQSASMVGFAVVIWTCCLTASVNMAVFTPPRRLPMSMMYFPTFPFCRAMYLLLDPCTWDTCLGDWGLAPDEFHEMTTYLFLNAVFYLLAAMYLHQVVPQ